MLFVSVLSLTACGTPPPRDFGGRWKPLNAFQKETREIPLGEAYLFQATPTDGTLKNMLTRWTHDTGMQLAYQHASDFTLHAPVAGIHTPNLVAATTELNAIYARQGLSIAVETKKIIVQAMHETPAIKD
ncbi:hypothetical protein [Dyella sp.]|uniref:hypothetical protein n=1 Tax=Dyella sp. TaxID=1869338 RepID=UPI002ECFCA7C